MAENRALIIGCGDIGRRLASLELAAGNGVVALARSEMAADRLIDYGMGVVSGDLDVPDSLQDLPSGAAVLYYLAPPPPVGAGDPRLDAFLAALSPDALPERLVYISTSGVYGDCQGAWVDEDWPVNPQTERARRRLSAEISLRAWGEDHGVPFVILRVPGIYGPGRLPVERIRQGIPVVCEEQSPYSNRIHADDLAQACFAAGRLGKPGGTYNVSDGRPTTMTDYFFQVADLLGLPRPPVITMQAAREALSPGMLSFLEESKRLDIRRMIEALQVTLRYPDLASGLAACLETSPVTYTRLGSFPAP